MEKISKALVVKENIAIYIQDDRDINLIDGSVVLQRVDRCEDADIVLVKDKFKPCNGTVLVFATSYKGFKKNKNAIGAFFYQKARPNVILKKKKLKKDGIRLPSEFDKYIE